MRAPSGSEKSIKPVNNRGLNKCHGYRLDIIITFFETMRLASYAESFLVCPVPIPLQNKKSSRNACRPSPAAIQMKSIFTLIYTLAHTCPVTPPSKPPWNVSTLMRVSRRNDAEVPEPGCGGGTTVSFRD